MKKLIGILSVSIFALTLFVNTNPEKNKDLNLASLIATNTANAELTSPVPSCQFQYFNVCYSTFINVTNCYLQDNGNCAVVW